MSLANLVLAINKDQDTPTEYLAEAAKKYPKFGGAACIENGVLSIFDGADVTPDQIDQMRQAAPGTTMVIRLYSGEQQPEDGQPFVLLEDADKNIVLAAFADGDFTSFAQTESGFSPEYHAINDYLIPKVDELIAKHNVGDASMADVLKMVVTDLAQSRTELDTALFGSKRGVICIMSTNGDLLHLQMGNPVALKAPWGWASDHCGTVKVEEKKLTFQRRGQTLAAPAAAVEKTTDVADMTWIKPPATVQTNQDIKSWYDKVFMTTGTTKKAGELPKGWAINMVLAKSPIQIAKDAMTDLVKAKIDFSEVVAIDPKSGTTTTKKPEGGSAIPTPALGTVAKTATVQLFNKDGSTAAAVLDHSSQKIQTIEQVKAVSAKYDDWFKQMSKNNPKFLDLAQSAPFWPYELFEDLAHTNQQSMAVFAWTMACRTAKAEDEATNLRAKLHPPKPAEPVKQPEPAKPAPVQFQRRKTG